MSATVHQSEQLQRAAVSGNVAIRLEHISHSYGERQALKGVSFEVRPAEIFGLLGPNGSGKTTMFRILSTLMLPSSGRATIMGTEVSAAPNAVRRHIGVVFQAQSVDVKLSAAENLMHQGHLYGLRGTQLKKRVREMLEHVALLDRANDKVETFSGGMQRRVELAKGLLHRPSVLLLDEPTTGLDPGARRDMWKYLDILRREQGVTVLVTTHLMEEAERCDRLAILSFGNLVALGSPSELKSQIGGDIVVLESSDAHALAGQVRARFGFESSVIGDKVRLELRNGHRFVSEVVEAIPGIQAVSVSKPTLEDVFIDRTGHRFWSDAEADQERQEK